MERQDRYTEASGILSALHKEKEKREDIKGKENFEMIEVVESKESAKPLTFKEVVKNNKGKEDVAIRSLVGNILASSNSEKIFMQVAKVLKNSMKDTDALGYDAATGQEVSKGAIKEAFRKYLGL